jgi:hypothetical protein
LKNAREANDSISNVKNPGKQPGGIFDEPAGLEARHIALLARYFPEHFERLSSDRLETVTNAISNGQANTLTTSFALQALRAWAHAKGKNAADRVVTALDSNSAELAKYETSGSSLLRAILPSETARVRFGFAPGQRASGALFYCQVAVSGFDKSPSSKPLMQGLEIAKEIVDATGNPVQKANCGDWLEVRLRVRSLLGRSLSNVAIVDLMPGGFETDPKSDRPSAQKNGMDHVDVREDRVVFFGTVGPESRLIKYKLKPTTAGVFSVPAPFAESMYDRNVCARGNTESIGIR